MAPQGGTTEAIHVIWGASASDVFAYADYGVLRRWDGARWTEQRSGPQNALSGIWGSDASNVWAVGWGGTILQRR